MTTQNLVAGLRSTTIHPTIRRIGLADVITALREGFNDFRANPTHLVFLCLIYPIVGLILGRMASGNDSLPLIYPLLGGFALIGPLASVGLYELSRRRELGLEVSVSNAFDVFRSRRIVAILALGGVFVGILIAWLATAQGIYEATMPAGSAASIREMATVVLTTAAGWRLIVLGSFVGLIFAVVALVTGVVSFPLLIDRSLAATSMEEAVLAVRTSIAASFVNPVAIAAWGLIVVVSMAIGVATLLVGLAVLMPVLGHGTWHLYRKLIAA